MKTDHHISQLLYRYQCVTVPGFGAFLTEIQPAQVLEDANSFYPPKKLISFNSYLQKNDGLLANHIAQSEKITYEAAVEKIREQVSDWKNLLYSEGRPTLKSIGDLTLNSERNLVFTPSEQANYLTESFGLSPFISPSVKREQFHQEVEALEERAPIAFTPERRASKGYLKYAAVFLLALTAVGSVGYKWQQEQMTQERIAIENAVQQKVTSRIQQATFFIENPLPAVKLAVKEEVMPYHVVAGAFRSEANAQKKYEDLIQKGFESKRLPQNKYGLYPVLFGSYSSYSEAKAAMAEIKRSQNPEAWLLIMDL